MIRQKFDVERTDDSNDRDDLASLILEKVVRHTSF